MTLRNAGYLQTSLVEDKVRNFAEDVVIKGSLVDSRYGQCYEVLGGRLVFPSGFLVTRQNINYSLGWMELLQLVAGVYNLRALMKVAPAADHSLFTEKMAYGPRIQSQVPEIIEKLKEDPNTRQAVLFVAKPEDGPTSDLPCTLTIQFLVRHGKLNAVVSMRSWDLCRGLPYDLMMFTGLLEIIGRCVGIRAGLVTVQAGSTHVYLDQMEKLPWIASKGWRFVGELPTNWTEFRGWATNNIPLLQKGGVPGLIEYATFA